MQVLLALTPVVLTLALLLTRLPAWVAPAAGAVLAVVLAPLVFGIPLATVGAALLAGEELADHEAQVRQEAAARAAAREAARNAAAQDEEARA